MARQKKPQQAVIQNPEELSKINGAKIAKREKRTLGIIAFFGLLTLMIGVVFAGYSFVNYRYETVPNVDVSETVFKVPKGSGLSVIATRLETAGLIDSAFIFKLVTKLRGNEANFKAGEFLITQPTSMRKIYDTLAEGKAILYPFTAPEGLTSAQIMRAMGGVATLVDDNPAIPAEGTLLPETYMTPRGMSRSALVKKMQDAQTALLDEIWEKRQEGLPIKTKEEAIILASVVEKETGIGSERDRVAGVFINRLRKNMRLQSDPTIIYGVSKGEPLFNRKGQRRTLYRSEIDRKTAWNTYQIEGLPATPICNPGAGALRAVLQPAKTDYLFFVADGSGGHVFAKTNREHTNNVIKWRKIERQRQREQR
jgi:UPF0755 protein